MFNKSSKLVIGFITYGDLTAKYLPYFLNSLSEQNYTDFEIIVIDNTEFQDNKNKKYLFENYPKIDFEWAGSNIGFSAAYNRMIEKAASRNAKYFLALNPDMIFERDMIGKLISELKNNKNLGSVCPKVLGWKFEENEKTNVIDSCGIKMMSGLRFVDVGQGELDSSKFDSVDILGPSGAVAMYRMEALRKIKQKNGYFDELMFMYKEDCDLAYRLFLAGFSSKCVSEARAFHDRTVSARGESDVQVARNRKHKSKQTKRWAFLNQHIIFVKFWRLQSFRNKLAIIWYEIKMIGFVILFERFLIGELWNLFKIWRKIERK